MIEDKFNESEVRSGALSRPVLTSGFTLASRPGTDIQRDQRVELCRVDHHVDLNFVIARDDPDRGDSQFIINVGVGPDAGAVGRFVFDLFFGEWRGRSDLRSVLTWRDGISITNEPRR